jgi:hypothetical protein
MVLGVSNPLTWPTSSRCRMRSRPASRRASSAGRRGEPAPTRRHARGAAYGIVEDGRSGRGAAPHSRRGSPEQGAGVPLVPERTGRSRLLPRERVGTRGARSRLQRALFDAHRLRVLPRCAGRRRRARERGELEDRSRGWSSRDPLRSRDARRQVLGSFDPMALATDSSDQIRERARPRPPSGRAPTDASGARRGRWRRDLRALRRSPRSSSTASRPALAQRRQARADRVGI